MRLLWTALFTGAIGLFGSGCGSNGGVGGFQGAGGGLEGGAPFDATSPGNLTTDTDGGSTTGTTPGCTPRTCTQAGANCGEVADGCGGVMQCGATCPAGQSCGGGGSPSVCGGAAPCVPKTCSDPSVASLCGQQADGCGGLILASCATCTPPKTCGGGGTPNVCGGAAACIPATATTVCVTTTGIPMNCGVMADGCGGTVPCGSGAPCASGESCGGAGIPNVCGSATILPLPDGGTTVIDAGPPVCTPVLETTACTGAGGVALCGPVSDGCGSTYTCSSCTGADSCGGGGTASVCGHPPCVPVSVATACTGAGGVALCGVVSDGCSGTLSCPSTCTFPATCGGDGVPSVCGVSAPSCTPKTCSDPSVATLCGPQGDGCGGVIPAPCVTCAPPATCGGGGTANVCGGSAGCVPASPSSVCVTSTGIPMNCGVMADGCGGTVTCGSGAPCPSGESCGGAGDPNVCGSTTIIPLPDGGTKTIDAGPPVCIPILETTACTGAGGVSLCGPESNGCGSTYTCPPCTGADSCGGGGTPSVCGHPACSPIPIGTACKGSGGVALCGVVGDGCSGTYTCPTTCTGSQTCGGGGTPSVCGVADGGPPCVPLTCSDSSVASLCGTQSNGCGGTIATPCVTCVAPATCGGGGTPSVCGGTAACIPATAGTACVTSTGIPMNCGVVANGCGGTITCGSGAACPSGETCGGAGDPNVCGSTTIIPLPDGGTKTIDAGPPPCVPIPIATACTGAGGVALCGPASNGCGGTYTCPACTGTLTCGGGGVPSVCGGATCTPLSTATACSLADGGTICGSVSDGCGGNLTCPTCSPTDTCEGSPAVCTAPPPCVPLTCASSSVKNLCGTQSNGCGGLIPSPCVTCTSPDICGGGGVPSVCGDSSATTACDAGLKCDLVACDAGSPTVLTGKITDPAGLNGLYNVVVYIPNSTPSALTHGQPSCVSCSSLYTGDPIVSATTDTDGNFTLSGVPVPSSGNVPIVIQVGKWRRQWVWPGVSQCITNTATTADEKYLRLPGAESTATPSPTATKDDLPQIAVSTGQADTMECLFKRIGFAASTSGGATEYACGWNSGVGHIHVFQGGGGQGGQTLSGCSVSSPTSLWNSTTDLDNYDIVVLSCEGEEAYDAVPANLQAFTSAGGRAFASHFHYSWFTGAPQDNSYGGTAYSAPAAWGSNLATWYPGANYVCGKGVGAKPCEDDTGNVEVLNANIVEKLSDGGTPFYDWLNNVGALGVNGAPSGELNIQQPRLNSAVTSADKPSQVWIVPDSLATYEYIDQNGTSHNPLPTSSTEYFSFNTPVGGTDAGTTSFCGRIVYSDLHVGAAANDYGGSVTTTPGGCTSGALTPQEKALEYMLLDLASCVGSDTNLPPATCTPSVTSCPAAIDGGIACGDIPNGCGGYVTCPSCPVGTCVSNVCSCTPLKACPAGYECGDYPDGCGGTIPCGTCTDPATTCIAGTCSTGCKPQPCPPSVTCGPTGNGCGGTIASCGTCPAGMTCGGGGVPSKCGEGDANACVPQACPPTITCGSTGDGCGGLVDCGSCAPPLSCGGGGTPGMCGAPSCKPATCSSLGAACGVQADGCGGVTASCGTCASGASCIGGSCVTCLPLTTCPAGVVCGAWPDGCGGSIPCGTCPTTDTCSGGVCTNGCTPIACPPSVTCGPTGDGCGGTITSCGPCAPGTTCGGGGSPGVCGAGDANACLPQPCPPTITCGKTGDGCGGLVDCGSCAAPLSCGGGGTPGVCGAPTCLPGNCTSLGATCGVQADGCGGLTVSCGTCAAGSCVAGTCVTCTPATTCPAGVVCGMWPDGCGGSITCGTCPVTEACVAGVCTSGCTPGVCPPTITCGPTGDGCGGTITSCGTCAPGMTCGGGGSPGVCGEGDANACLPQACPSTITCGPTGDGCGGIVNCGTCTPPLTCGGGGSPGVCGAPSCTAATCASLGATCGQVADGCGGLTPSCGACSGSDTCGGGGTANKCGTPPCTPSTCTSLGVNCGAVGDGCGNALQCGNCTAPDTCGGGGTANVCGTAGVK